jgi:hypothetical protein
MDSFLVLININTSVNVKTKCLFFYILPPPPPPISCSTQDSQSVDYEDLLSSGIYCHVVWQKSTDVLEECTASIFRVKE